MPSQSSPEIPFQKLRKRVEQAFQKYRETGNPAVFDVASLWIQFNAELDIDTFLKPIVKGCYDLIYEDSLCDDQRSNRAKDLGRICVDVESIQRTEQGINLGCFLAWLKFHLVRLRGLTLTPDAGNQLNEWLRMCYDPEDRQTAHFFALFRVSRDQEMRQLIFDEQGRVRNFFCSKITPGSLYLPKLAGWFLRRYDLAAAFAVLHAITFDSPTPNKAIQHGIGLRFWRRNWKAFLLAVLLLSFMVVPAAGMMWELWPALTSVIECLPLGLDENAWVPQSSVDTWHMLVYPIGSALLTLPCFYFFLWSWRKRRFDNLGRVLPRMMAGILIGYVPLMSASDPWKWLLQMPPIPSTALSLIILGISLGYLYVEARKTLTEGELCETMRRELRIRVFHVFFIGLSEALIIGLVLSELFGATVVHNLLNDLKETPIIAVAGWVGYIFPKVIIVYAPLALFLGILVQLLWEEKTVAQPL